VNYGRVGLLEERMRTPRHLGPLAGGHASGSKGNPACGDVLTMHLRIAGGRIEAASFESIGSAYQLATADVLCDCVVGERVREARRRGPDCVLELLPDLPEHHRYLAHLAIEALHRAIDGHERPHDEAGARHIDEAAARAFVVDLLQHGPCTVVGVEQQAAAEGIELPQSGPRFLAQLRREGVVVGELDPERQHWVWRVSDAP
jgi:nitrogen fixation protein NifU and related proteins